MKVYDVIIIGAGAAGLMCAIEAAKRKRHVLLLDHANKAGKKILISGGGRCNFTNLNTSPTHYLSHNPSFCISALSRYTPQHFLDLIKRYKITYHEKTLGQLFCDHSSKEIVNMLLSEVQDHRVEILLNCKVTDIIRPDNFQLSTSQGKFSAKSLVVATGGLSFPTMGASAFGYKIAEQFGLKVYPPRAALVPFTLMEKDLNRFKELSGLSALVEVSCAGKTFKESLLFTHRGLSGPAILQISSFWQPSTPIHINWLPDMSLYNYLLEQKKQHLKAELKTLLNEHLAKRLVGLLLDEGMAKKSVAQVSDKELKEMAGHLSAWQIIPNGTEGYRTAEVTLGGVDCDELSSRTMEAKKVPGLYFIGEVVDVTGELGGYNFQWAWASAWCAAQVV